MHHGSARLTVHGRRTLVERVTAQGWSITKAAWAAGVSPGWAAESFTSPPFRSGGTAPGGPVPEFPPGLTGAN